MMMPLRILLCLTLPLAVALGSDVLFRLLEELRCARRGPARCGRDLSGRPR